MYCSGCGNQLLSSDQFCDRCGKSQANQRNEVNQSQIDQCQTEKFQTDQYQIDQSCDWSIREKQNKETSTEKS